MSGTFPAQGWQVAFSTEGRVLLRLLHACGCCRTDIWLSPEQLSGELMPALEFAGASARTQHSAGMARQAEGTA